MATQNHITTPLARRAFLSRAVVALSAGASCTGTLAAINAPAEAAKPPMTFAEARVAYPVTVKEAQAIMYEFYRNDGALFAKD